MNLLHFLLFVLLGFLASPAAALPHETIDVAIGNIGHDVDRTAGGELAARQGYPNSLLLNYDLKCALDREKTPFAPYARGSYLAAAYCKTWFECQSDGTKKATDKQHKAKPPTLEHANQEWCKDWCECVLIDEPQMHPAENFGCVNPIGEQIHGSFGSVSRDMDSSSVNDGLVMEAFEGPPRKE